jgi:biopolymer transport protein ExbB
MLNFILSQVTLTGDSAVPNIPSAGAEVTVKTISYWEMIGRGGPVMVAMGILSVLLIYLFVERLLVIMKASKSDSNLVPAVKEMMVNGNIDGARKLCSANATPVARMLEKGISRLGKPVNEIERAMESAGKIELNRVERNLGYLSTIAAVAPLFGFVGTIFGVITIFYNISQTGDFGIQTISEGLYQKMVTSAAGIIIGILAFISHHFLHNMIERLVARMEEASLNFLDIISEPGN